MSKARKTQLIHSRPVCFSAALPYAITPLASRVLTAGPKLFAVLRAANKNRLTGLRAPYCHFSALMLNVKEKNVLFLCFNVYIFFKRGWPPQYK